jgi:hypothetical protein
VVATRFVAQLQVHLELRVKWSRIHAKHLFSVFAPLKHVVAIGFVAQLQVDLQLREEFSRSVLNRHFHFVPLAKCCRNWVCCPVASGLGTVASTLATGREMFQNSC